MVRFDDFGMMLDANLNSPEMEIPIEINTLWRRGTPIWNNEQIWLT
jgi:hypothetical protein